MRFVLHLDALVAERLRLFREENLEVSPSEHGGLSLTDTKVDERSAHGERTFHFAVRYIILLCCHYQRSAAVVLENVGYSSRQLF